jgi:hypothetical protein
MPRRQRNLEKEALWRQRLNDWKLSSDSIAEFCKLHELNEHTFRSWQKIIPVRDAEARAERQQVKGREQQRIEKAGLHRSRFGALQMQKLSPKRSRFLSSGPGRSRSSLSSFSQA